MPRIGHKIILFFLRLLMYMKRALVWIWEKLRRLFSWLGELYQSTIGIRLYKLFFFHHKTYDRLSLPWGGRMLEFFGRRGTLQFVLFLVVLAIMIPESKLYSQTNQITLPGQKTLLYTIAGPGEEIGQIEEISGVPAVTDIQPSRSWREGAVAIEAGYAPGSAAHNTADISSVGLGGLAISKPTIMPGFALPTVNTAVVDTNTGRNQVIVYEVQPGDVIGSIASKYGISIPTILWANNLTARSVIRPGDKLNILPVSGVVYSVKRGDTLAKIAKIYQADPTDIIAFNHLPPNGNVSVGSYLIIPDGIQPIVVQQVAESPTQNTPPPPPTAAPSERISLDTVVVPSASTEAPADTGFIWPTAVRRITQYFSIRHTGVDIAGPIGTPIYAAKAGVVIKSQCGFNGGYGCHVIIDHGGNIQTLYGHASKLLVEVGQQVEQGQVIALMGSTGHSTGPHCHFEVRANGHRVNPLQYVH